MNDAMTVKKVHAAQDLPDDVLKKAPNTWEPTGLLKTYANSSTPKGSFDSALISLVSLLLIKADPNPQKMLEFARCL